MTTPDSAMALTTLDISKNYLTRGALKAGKSGKNNWDYATDMTGMTAPLGVDISSLPDTHLFTGIIAIAGAIKDMRAILSVNILQNKIGINEAKVLASILDEHPTLKSLCGNRGDETKLDMSGTTGA
jgi:hypothetical protein